jgi:hypothetical protein
MNIRYQQTRGLPKLAWLADVNKTNDLVQVCHGSHVEIQERFFVEGTWNDLFQEGDFASTDCIFGSGGIIDKNGIIFVSSASTTDYLYYKNTDDRVFVSNSLPFLLSHTDDLLDPTFLGYHRINESITEGINKYIHEIPTLHGAIRRLMYRNLIVSTERVTETEKDMPPRFECYGDYYKYIVANYEMITKNIRDSARMHKMEIFSTQSKGYDTTAVNAIAAKYGVDKVFTVSKGKGAGYFATKDEGAQVNDDGTEICSTLGLNCIRIDRRAFETDFEKEYLYYSVLDDNQDLNLVQINKYISSVSILLTGTLGEIWCTKQWYKDRPGFINSELLRGDLGTHTLSEIRLLAGFIQLPLPYIGARRREDIFRITESGEMNAWCLGNSYDRPIPRRIAEEAGVPRDLFGQKKMATVVEFPPPHIPYNRQLREEFFTFLDKNHLLSRWKSRLFPVIHDINSVLTFCGVWKKYKWIYYLERAISKIIKKDYRFPFLWNRLNGSIFCFCVNKRAAEYKNIMSDVDLDKK